jgi:hypothetical protein
MTRPTQIEKSCGQCPHCSWRGPYRLSRARAIGDTNVHIEREHPTEGRHG